MTKQDLKNCIISYKIIQDLASLMDHTQPNKIIQDFAQRISGLLIGCTHQRKEDMQC